MSLKMSTHLANKVLEAVTKGVSVSYTNLYISLHSADPGDTGASEVAISRKETATGDWATASFKSSATVSPFEYSSMPAVTVTHIGLWDAATGGNFLWNGELAVAKTVPAGETLRFDAGNIVAQIDPA